MLAYERCILQRYHLLCRCSSAVRRSYATNANVVPKRDIVVINPLRTASIDPRIIRSVIRSLFREATYLPDKSARVWVTRQIRQRCRYHAHERGRAKVDSLIRDAKEQYSLLKRANLGARLPLLRILRHTYGRAGTRRHVLLEKYIRPLPAYVTTGVKHNLEEKASSNNTVWKSRANVEEIVSAPKQDGDKNVFSLSHKNENLDHLLRSQKANLGYPNRLTLAIPRQNTWLRSMPDLIVRNRITKWYEYLLKNVLPPLPLSEWELLRAKAWGLHNEPLPVRRKIISSADNTKDKDNSKIIIQHVKDEELEDLNWLEAAKSAILSAEAHREKLRLPERGKVGRHNLTARFVQRQLTAVFCECPVEMWDDKNHKAKFKWGTPKVKFLHLQQVS